MTTLTPTLIAKLRAARRSHCFTCGCARCKRIEQLLQHSGAQVDLSSTEADTWLLEGQLVRDLASGNWSIQNGTTLIPLGDYLSPWVGYTVSILIGPEQINAESIIES